MKHLRTTALETLRLKLRRFIVDDAENMDEVLVDELEEQIILKVRAGFLSNDKIAEECMEYILEEYPEVKDHVSVDELQEIVKGYCDEYVNAGDQENYLKLASAFQKLNEQGIVALHCVGYVQSDGFDDCNEIAADMDENGQTVIGSCFYTLQDLEHVLNEETTKLRISFGNYFDKPTAVEIGKIIVKELEEAGFVTEWEQNADEKIAIRDMVWDKVFEMQYPETGTGDFIARQGVLVKYTGSDETVVIPEGIMEIGPWAFKDCISLVNITIPDSVSTIKYSAFAGCASLSDIVFPEGITEIESFTFNGCTSLTGISVPESVKSLDGTIFNGCTALAGITLPVSRYQISDALVLSVIWNRLDFMKKNCK